MPAQKKKSAKTKTGDSTAIEVALPGLSATEKPLIDKAIDDLNTLYTRKGLETAEAIGDYILQAFFEGDIDNYNQFGRKHATFKALTEHDGLQFSASYLWFAVTVSEQVKFLRANGITDDLPLSHHRLLVAVKDNDKKLALAQRAVEKGMSKRAFETAVRKKRGSAGGSSGRPPLPAFAKGFTKLLQAIELAVSEEVTDESFEHYDAEQAEELLGEVDAGLEQLQALRKTLTRQIGVAKKSAN
jgi:hypothetical protein